jgi:glycosyltransferase involved in cell wall biosynthesis
MNNKLKKYKALHNKSRETYDMLMGLLSDNTPGNNDNEKFTHGISIIIPSYNGEHTIEKTLLSLSEQTLNPSEFEVIIILNGPDRIESKNIIEDFLAFHENINLRIIETEIANAAHARNLGIENACYSYTSFLDDDDFLSEDYLKSMLNLATMDSVVISEIHDVTTEGEVFNNTHINRQVIQASAKKELSLLDLNMVLTITVCKLIPTNRIKKYQFDETLNNGEDVLFFTTFFAHEFVDLVVVPQNKAIYYRVLRDGSVSRQSMSFEFNVEDRLKVIKGINNLIMDDIYSYSQLFVENKIHAQSSFIFRYLKEFPQDFDRVKEVLNNYFLNTFPYSQLNKGRAQMLVVSYCFPPYIDTSANVMAKRIRNENKIVDVIYNDMSAVRKVDDRINGLVDDLIDQRIIINTPSSFSGWEAIKSFVDTAFGQVNFKKNYQSVYSRVMWPGSHFLAYKVKKKKPDLIWKAEYSDPILYDIHGNKRYSKINDHKYLKSLYKHIKKEFKIKVKKNDNLFFWAEYLPYFFSDELIFTNENQLEYMLGRLIIPELKERIIRKASILEHPTLPGKYYDIVKTNYILDENKINLAYFGNFYATRKLDDLFLGLNNIDHSIQEKINLHVFTSNPEELELEVSNTMKNPGLVKVNSYVSYLEFLNLTKSFDCLIVNDAVTKDVLELNPFLPSKLSDYQGSGNKVWGIYESGSVLSLKNLDYKTELGDIDAVEKVYEKMIMERSEALA